MLVSEIIGDDPFNEQIIEMTSDARLRFLKPNARMVPNSIEVFGLPLTIPAEKYAKYKFSNQSVTEWSRWYGIDFSALTKMQHDENEPLFNIRPQDAKVWNRMHAPLRLANVDLHQDRDQRLDSSESIRARTSGLLNGLLIYFEVQLSPQIRLSTHPDNASSENHWYSPVWGVIPTIDVQIGDEITVKYEADSRRNWTYAHVFKGKNLKR